MSSHAPLVPVLSLAFVASACVSLDYDVSAVPMAVSAKPAEPGPGQTVVPFRIEAHNVLWFDGLFGHSMPDVAQLVTEEARGSAGIANFRVSNETNFHEWLLTHLSLTLVRMKTVVIRGELVRGAG